MILYHGSLEIIEKSFIKELKAYKLADQSLFHSSKSLEFLKFEKAVKISK